jgi:hypothetical protein
MAPCGISFTLTVVFLFAPRTCARQGHWTGVERARDACRGRVKPRKREELAYARRRDGFRDAEKLETTNRVTGLVLLASTILLPGI